MGYRFCRYSAHLLSSASLQCNGFTVPQHSLPTAVLWRLVCARWQKLYAPGKGDLNAQWNHPLSF